MIFFYTRTQKTKVFAEVLRDILQLPLIELHSVIKATGFFPLLHCCLLAVAKKPCKVENMPDKIESAEIFLCAPVWAGQMAPPARYFLQQAPLRDKKVNLLLTCASITGCEAYKAAAAETLRQLPCIPGEILVFATTRETPDRVVLTEQIQKMLTGGTEIERP